MVEKEIYAKIKAVGAFNWQIADQAGVSETTLRRWCRAGVTPEHQAIIEKAIEEFAAQKNK